MSEKVAATFAPYPRPTVERRRIVQELGAMAARLDVEAAGRANMGAHDDTVRHELLNSSAALRLVATLIIQGGMSTKRARYWIHAAADYMALVGRVDHAGIMRDVVDPETHVSEETGR